MCLSAHKKCPPLEHGIEDSNLTQWLRDNTGLTTKLAKEIVKPFLEWRAEHLHIGTTWNEAVDVEIIDRRSSGVVLVRQLFVTIPARAKRSIFVRSSFGTTGIPTVEEPRKVQNAPLSHRKK